ncbi:hypothetical protein DFP72DRAFT_852761 [Ephemerocybe angulata]|uniref:Uncharacterized protein n=1 Tax=Ephemerocybe angulata TaxID=980116 RepID=A0A8H6HPB0_9AGAR|nr:hypothetical protein DFP72DRAFT_852761 [Tulosesus angulatus]
MGRRAKYYTLADKANARKIQRAKTKHTPESKAQVSAGGRAIARRKAENRRQYLKLKPIPVVPKPVRRHSWAPMSWMQWRSVYERFHQGEDTLFLNELELVGDDFAALVQLPPYCSSVTSLANFNDLWGELSAALHGYMTSRYIQETEARANRMKSARDSDIREELWEQHRTLTKTWNDLTDFLGVKSILQYTLSELIAMINMQWTSRLIVFAVEDLEAFKGGRVCFLRTSTDRLWEMGLPRTT